MEAWTQNEVVYFFREMDATSNNPNKPIEPHIFVLKISTQNNQIKKKWTKGPKRKLPSEDVQRTGG